MVVDNFHTLLSIMNRITKQKIREETEALSITINKVELTDTQISRIHIFLKCTWTILQDRPYARIQRFVFIQMFEIIQSVFSDHNGIKLEISNRRKTGKFTSLRKLVNILLHNTIHPITRILFFSSQFHLESNLETETDSNSPTRDKVLLWAKEDQDSKLVEEDDQAFYKHALGSVLSPRSRRGPAQTIL